LTFWHFGIFALLHYDILAFWHFGILTFWHFGITGVTVIQRLGRRPALGNRIGDDGNDGSTRGLHRRPSRRNPSKDLAK